LDKKVEDATWAINLSYNRAIGTSPYILNYGKNFVSNNDLKRGCVGKIFERKGLYTKRDACFEKYKKHIIKGKVLLKCDIKVGEKVFVFRPKTSNKLKANWYGGFVVVDVVPPDAFLVRKLGSEIIWRVNKRHIKRDMTLN
jgi:hypothetical protein